MQLKETKEKSEFIFDGKILHLYKDDVRLPNGKTAERECIRHIGAVCIIPYQDGMVYVERQYRYPVDEIIVEIPAGKLDFKEEDRLEAAKRELKEETGLSADKWTELGLFYPAAAYSDEAITMYLAEELSQGERHLDDDEFLDVYAVPLKDLLKDVMDGKIQDAKTQVAILKLANLKNISL